MALTYTITSADDDPIPPAALRELRDLIAEDDDLDLGVRLTDRAPRPGEQGAIPVAVQIVAATTPLSAALASVLKQWIRKHTRSINITREDGSSIQLNGVSVEGAQRLIASLDKGKKDKPTGPEQRK